MMKPRMSWSKSCVFLLLWLDGFLCSPDTENSHPPKIVREIMPSVCFEGSCEDTVYINFKESLPIKLPCNASGYPKISYQWQKDGKRFPLTSGRIDQTAGTGSFIIRNTSSSDQGVYQCFASNSKGTAMSKKAVLIYSDVEPFKKLQKPYVVIAKGGLPLSLKCEKPSSVYRPEPSIFWSKEYNGTNPEKDPGEIVTVGDKRVATDYEGNLHFAYILKSDTTNNIYTCNMYYPKYRSFATGSDTIIDLQLGETISQNPVKLMWKSDDNVVRVRGELIRFMCIFSGNPTPTITWTWNGASLDTEKMWLYKSGHELRIRDVDFNDAGGYECTAANSFTPVPVTVKFNLTVEAKPYWVNGPPADLTVGEGDDAEFHCLVNGTPKPIISWDINARLIQEITNPRMTVEKNRVLFKGVHKTDSQVIQCRASNKHGSIMANAYLNVQGFPPKITKGPGIIIVEQGKSVNMSCGYTGRPEPRLIWKKGYQTIRSSAKLQITPGTLTITDADLTDEGIYICQAENKYGFQSERGELIIKHDTLIEVIPKTHTLIYGSNATLKCSIDTVLKVSFTWFKNGELIKRNVETDLANSLTIRNITTKDSGNYSCHANNSESEVIGVGELRVQAPPEAPYGVKITSATSSGATLTWKVGFNNYLSIRYFNIYAETQYFDDLRNIAQAPGNATSIDLWLQPYTRYTFKVSAVNELGQSELSTAPSAYTTEPDLPFYHPRNVKTVENRTGYLVVQWDPVEPIDQNGPGFRYIVQIRHLSTLDSMFFVVRDWQKTELVVDVGGKIYEPYTVKVTSGNDLGDAQTDVLTINGHSGMGIPLVFPQNLERIPEIENEDNLLGLQWDPPMDISDQAIAGKFSGYKINYWPTDNPHNVLSKPVDQLKEQGLKVRATIKLPSNSKLSVNVVVSNTYFDSIGSNVINVSTTSVNCSVNTDKGSTSTTRCKEGWIRNNNSCYLFSRTTAQWGSALSICQGFKSSLVAIDNKDEYIFLRKHLMRDRKLKKGRWGIYFTGGNDIEVNKEYKWILNGETISYYNWAAGYPNMRKGEDCITLNFYSGYRWHNMECDSSYRFICEQ